MNKYFFLLVISAATVFYSCEKTPGHPDTDLSEFCIPDSLMANITFDTVKTENISSELKLTGKISFNEDHVVRVFPLVSGHISDVKVSIGDYVHKGQVLAQILSSDMAGYTSEYKSAQSELAIAKKNLDVTTEMKNSGISSEKDLLTAKNEYDKTLSSFNKMKEVMKVYGSNDESENGSEFVLKAEMDGFIVEKNITTGMELRADDANSLFVISDLKDLWAIANVYETDIAKIKEGSQPDISTLSYPDKKFTGKIEKVSNVLNPETNTMTVKVHLDNNDYLLKPGMFATVSIRFPETRKTLSVPSSAILYDDNKSFVVSFNKRCDVDLREINILKSISDTAFIECDSLKEGNLVIDRNNLFVFTALRKL
jgi:cobalt-zinc-cadmium efflux system membrane fusion protein